MKGYSLHIGLNTVDKNAYKPYSIPDLLGCHNDAKSMKAIAEKLGYQTQLLLDDQATSAQVVNSIVKTSLLLQNGDIFLLTYSGHGSQVLDQNKDEDDGLDETWVLYDKQLIDDMLFALLSNLPANSRLVVISDSCHSGTIVRNINPVKVTEKQEKLATLKASGVLISGCQDHQYSYDGAVNGLFTEKLLKVWNDGNFKGTYKQFTTAITKLLPRQQRPNYLSFGAKNLKFVRQKPFTI